MKLPPFEIHRPTSLADASRLLAEFGDDAVAVNGGTELLLTMKLGLALYDNLVDLKRVPELRGLDVRVLDDGASVLRIGAGMTHREVENSPLVRERFPALSAMLAHVANVRVRSVGTLGGNLCFADPHSDPATFLAAAGATLVLGGAISTREVPVDSFVLGPYETVLSRGELLVAIEVPLPAEGAGVAHVRMKTHERPTVTVASSVQLRGGSVVAARLAVGSVCSVPVVPATAGALLGASLEDFDARVASCAAATARAVDPLADADGAIDYKRALVEVYVRRSLHQALALASAA